MKSKKLDRFANKYEVCLLGWYFGILPKDVVKKEWTDEQIEKAQAYCEKVYADPIAYWGEEW